MIHHFKDDRLVCITFEKGHELHGEIRHIEDGILAHITFEKDHAFHGEIRHFEGGEFQGHYGGTTGDVDFSPKDGKHVRTTFEEGHRLHGWIHHFNVKVCDTRRALKRRRL